MAYSDKVIDHYENPRNVGKMDEADVNVGTGMVGAPACGDVMRLQIKVNDEGVIEDAKFKTFVDTLFYVIHLCPIDVCQALGVYHDFYAMIFEYSIAQFQRIHKLEDISHAGAACSFYPHPDADAMTTSSQLISDVFSGGLCERYSHGAINDNRPVSGLILRACSSRRQ